MSEAVPGDAGDILPVGVERMFRIYLMRQRHGTCDPAVGENLYDIEAMRRFAGVVLGLAPDETAIRRAAFSLRRRRSETSRADRPPCFFPPNNVVA